MSTKTKTCCPNCQKAFDVPTEYLGKRATCASCKTKFVVTAPEPKATDLEDYALQAVESSFPAWMSSPAQPQSVPIALAPIQSEPLVTAVQKPSQLPPPTPTQYKAKSKRFVDAKIWVPIVVGLCSLVVGYFAGREHLKYQVRSTVQQAFQNAFPGIAAASKPASTPSVTKATQPPPELPPLSIGQQFQQTGFSLALTKATIAKAKLKSSFGDNTVESDEDQLILSFTFSNTEDRKQRAFHDGGSTFSSSKLRLKDDVGNVIRGVDFGFSAKLIGTLDSYHDIPPGESVNHIKVFSLPLPKTKYVVLTIDLTCLGGDGEMSYLIPMASISRKQ